MLNDLLHYDLKIFQNEDSFKFSIDSVLLAEFVNITDKCRNIMDLCTGNAPIPLILSTKFKKNIYGVELQKEIFDLAKKTIDYNNIKNITLINENILNLELNEKMDIVTCNPPYFKINNQSLINENMSKAIARHEIAVKLEDVIRIASDILKYSGSLCLVHRCERFTEILELFKKYNFGLRRLQFVYNSQNSESCFLLIEGKLNCKDDLKVLKPLYIDKYLEEI